VPRIRSWPSVSRDQALRRNEWKTSSSLQAFEMKKDASSHEELTRQVLLLSSRDGSHSGVSGYSTLARYLPEATFLEVYRQSPRNVLTRFLTAINRRLTLVHWAWGSSIRLEWQALRMLKKDPNRIVHYLWADRDMAYLDLIKAQLGCKIVGTFHNCPDQLDNLFNFPRRIHSIDHFIVVSSCQVKDLERIGVPRSKISVVLHGVDTEHFRPDPTRKTKKFRVLSVGSWRRDTECMEEVFRRLGADNEIESICLVQENWRKRWANLPNLQLPERISDEELLRLLQSSDVLLMCAKAATANNALVEALACGLPVVSSDTGGLREYATDEAALFFQQGDPQGAVERIHRIKESRELAASLARGARKRSEELDWRKIRDQIVEKYLTVANRPDAGRRGE
jgi:glycosyltransferase involved in cell wall biosynthesis